MAESRRKLREQRDELVTALEHLTADFDLMYAGSVGVCPFEDRETVQMARAALAKARKQPE